MWFGGGDWRRKGSDWGQWWCLKVGDGPMTGVRGRETDVNWRLKVGFFK